jgi:hypothetical protein
MTDNQIIADQQDKALSVLRDMILKESEYRQMGFIRIAQEYREEIRKVEKWIAKLPAT